MFEKYQQRAVTQVDTTASEMGANALAYKQRTEQQAMSVTHQATQSLLSGMARIAGSAIDYQNKLIEKENEQVIAKAAVDGELSVSMEQYQADLKEGDDPYSVAYNKAATAKVFSNIRTLASNRMAEIAAETESDPVAFRAKVTGLADAIAEELKLGDESRAVLSRTIDEGYARFAPQIIKNGYVQAKREETAAFNEVMLQTTNTALNDIRSGNFDRLNSLYEDWATVFDEGVSRGIYSPEDKAKVFNGVLLEGNEQMVMSYADAAEKTKNFAGAKRAIETWKASAVETGQFSPDQIDVIEGRGIEAINRAEYAYKQQLKEQQVQLEKANEKQQSIDRIKSSLDSGFALPSNKANQKDIDTFYSEVMTGFSLQNQKHIELASQVVSKTKLIPTQIIEALDIAALSENPANLEGAVQMYTQLKELSPRTLANSSDPDTAAFYESTARLMKSGLSIEEARQISFKNVFEQDEQTSKVLKTRMENKEYIKARKGGAQEVLNSMKLGWFDMDDLSEMGASGLEYEADYSVMFDSFYQKAGGDIEAAKSLTNDRIRRKWSATDINGKWQPMRFSPESLYGGDGDNSWIKEQWQEQDLPELIKMKGLPEDAEIKLIPHVETGRGKPTWKIMRVVRNDDGQIVSFEDIQDDKGVSLTWFPDWSKYADKMGIGDKAERRLESAKRQWEANNVLNRKGASIPQAHNYIPDLEMKNSTIFIKGW